MLSPRFWDNQSTAQVGQSYASLIFAGEVVLFPWMLLVLMREDVQSAFAQANNKSRPLLEWGMAVFVMLIMFGAVHVPVENRLPNRCLFHQSQTSGNRDYERTDLRPGGGAGVDGY